MAGAGGFTCFAWLPSRNLGAAIASICGADDRESAAAGLVRCHQPTVDGGIPD